MDLEKYKDAIMGKLRAALPAHETLKGEAAAWSEIVDAVTATDRKPERNPETAADRQQRYIKLDRLLTDLRKQLAALQGDDFLREPLAYANGEEIPSGGSYTVNEDLEWIDPPADDTDDFELLPNHEQARHNVARALNLIVWMHDQVVRAKPYAKPSRGAPRDPAGPSVERLVARLAQVYWHTTGKKPAFGGEKPGPFQRFVEAVVREAKLPFAGKTTTAIREVVKHLDNLGPDYTRSAAEVFGPFIERRRAAGR